MIDFDDSNIIEQIEYLLINKVDISVISTITENINIIDNKLTEVTNDVEELKNLHIDEILAISGDITTLLESATKIGDLTTLDTIEKNTLVEAINNNYNDISNTNSKIGALNT